MQNGGGGGIPMEELQRQQQGLTDPEGQGRVFSVILTDSLSFYTSKMILDTSKLFWTVQIVYVRSKSFCSGQNNFHQVQIRLFWTNFYDLDPTKMNWTRPKRLTIDQTYLDGPN